MYGCVYFCFLLFYCYCFLCLVWCIVFGILILICVGSWCMCSFLLVYLVVLLLMVVLFGLLVYGYGRIMLLIGGIRFGCIFSISCLLLCCRWQLSWFCGVCRFCIVMFLFCSQVVGMLVVNISVLFMLWLQVNMFRVECMKFEVIQVCGRLLIKNGLCGVCEIILVYWFQVCGVWFLKKNLVVCQV